LAMHWWAYSCSTPPTMEDAPARWVIATGDAGIGASVSGLHHTSSLRNLVVMRKKTMHIVKILDGRGGNPLESGHLEAYKLNLYYHCNYLYSNKDSIKMILDDTVIITTMPLCSANPSTCLRRSTTASPCTA
jgi:hypothetical protein